LIARPRAGRLRSPGPPDSPTGAALYAVRLWYAPLAGAETPLRQHLERAVERAKGLGVRASLGSSPAAADAAWPAAAGDEASVLVELLFADRTAFERSPYGLAGALAAAFIQGTGRFTRRAAEIESLHDAAP
jgi:hypothetical protein